jgi:subtilase family serine protease
VAAGIERFTDLGPTDPNSDITITVQLAMHDQAAFDAAVQALYTPGSPTFHQWMTDADIAKYAPTAEELATVRHELERHGLTVIWTDPLGLSIRVRGNAAQAESAFKTNLHEFSYQGRSLRANISDARLAGKAGDLVAGVSGLERHTVQPMLRRALNARNGVPLSRPAAQVQSNSGIESFLTNVCITKPENFSFTTPGASLPFANYYGHVYARNPDLACAFTAAQLQEHYGLTEAYARGWNGEGQTIVLVDAYGYADIQADANAFSRIMGLPLLDSHNFQIVHPYNIYPTNPGAATLLQWDFETAIDVEWAHAMAPGAKIVLLISPGQDSTDMLFTLQNVTHYHVAGSVSNSWGVDIDYIAGPLELAAFNIQLKLMVAKGMSVNFASGDSGDNGLGTPVGAPEVPSNSPFATAVGGTSILSHLYGGTAELGWGNNLTTIYDNGILDPPAVGGNVGGAGGGESTFFAKPSWQKNLPGTGRQVPDIAALADPYTGVPIVVTQNGVQSIYIFGGTSVACPVFSAIWAITNQVAGKLLGQAAPIIADLPSRAISDILPVDSAFNVLGVIKEPFGTTRYSATELVAPPDQPIQNAFVSALWHVPPSQETPALFNVVSFGTDTSLSVTPGWDNVTGFGTPNGVAFIKAAAAKK